jgi:hypothetical protein
MITKYIIEMRHNRCIGNYLTYYYYGKSKEGADVFGFNKQSAKRYESKDTVLEDMTTLQTVHCCGTGYSDTFQVRQVRCRV